MSQNYQEKIGRQIESLRTIQRKCHVAGQYYQLAASAAQQGELKDYFHTFAQCQANREQKLKREIIALDNRMDLMRSQIPDSSRFPSATGRPTAEASDLILLKSAIRLERLLLHYSERALKQVSPKSSTFVLLIEQRNATRTELAKLEQLLPRFREA